MSIISSILGLPGWIPVHFLSILTLMIILKIGLNRRKQSVLCTVIFAQKNLKFSIVAKICAFICQKHFLSYRIKLNISLQLISFIIYLKLKTKKELNKTLITLKMWWNVVFLELIFFYNFLAEDQIYPFVWLFFSRLNLSLFSAFFKWKSFDLQLVNFLRSYIISADELQALARIQVII